MSEELGGFKSTPDFYDGVEIGRTETSEQFDVGKHCTGLSYDGRSVGSVWLKGGDEGDDISITKITDEEYQLAMMHTTSLDNWEKLLEGALNHVKQLKLGKQL